MKKIILIVAMTIASFVFTNSAIASPHEKNNNIQISKKIEKQKKTKLIEKVIEKPAIVYDEETSSGYWAAEKERSLRAAAAIPVKQTTAKSSTINLWNEDSELANKAGKYMGATASQLGLPSTLWCADFMNMLVGGSDRSAASYLKRGKVAPHGCVNCVAVTTRRGGAHVGVVAGYEGGNPVIISGNHLGKVGVAVYRREKVIGYRTL
jgi:uncharacterized protein (TIGR02594 family)